MWIYAVTAEAVKVMFILLGLLMIAAILFIIYKLLVHCCSIDFDAHRRKSDFSVYHKKKYIYYRRKTDNNVVRQSDLRQLEQARGSL